MSEIRGTCADEFQAVQDAFEENFQINGEVGAGLSVYLDGEQVVNLTGGVKNLEGEQYDENTLQMVFSTTKGAAAMCVHHLADQGKIDFDRPVTTYWPEFGQAGKDVITVRQLLSHQAGLVDVDGVMSLDEALDWHGVCDKLAQTNPLWTPGDGHGYHAVTFGWLVGELVRRIDGRTIGTYFAEELVAPLGIEFWIGTPAAQHHRVAPLIGFDPIPGMGGSADAGTDAVTPSGESDQEPRKSPSLVDMLEKVFGVANLLGRALAAPGGAFAAEDAWRHPGMLEAEIPAANGVTNAPSLAKLYAATIGSVDGFQVMSDSARRAATTPQTSGADKVLMFPSSFGLGFMLNTPFSPLGGGDAFGHYGAGGSVGWADHDRRLAFGYVMNKMQLGLAGDPRTANLMRALNTCMGNL